MLTSLPTGLPRDWIVSTRDVTNANGYDDDGGGRGMKGPGCYGSGDCLGRLSS